MKNERIVLRALRRRDLAAALALWKRTEGMGMTASDTLPALTAFLRRNRGFSSAATVGGKLVGAVLCGHDMRRGFLYHLAVASAHRGRGIGAKLRDRSLGKLRDLGLEKCNILVYADNDEGLAFWRRAGWTARDELKILQKKL